MEYHYSITFLDDTLKDKQPPKRLLGSSQLGKYHFSLKKTYHFDNGLFKCI